MTDALELVIILVAVFLGECLTMVRFDGTAFTAWWPGRYRASSPFALRGSRAVGVVLAPPWPPLESSFPTEPLVLDLSPETLRVGEQVIPWESVAAVRASGRDVLVGPERLTTSATERGAAHMAAWLDGLRVRKGRTDALTRGLDARFDVVSARLRLAQARADLLWLRVGATVLYCALFVFMPLSLFTELPIAGWTVAAVAGAGWATVVVAALWRRRALGLEGGQLVVVTLSPLATLRAADLVLRETLLGLEPVAAACVLGSPDTADLARRALADWTLRRQRTWLAEQLAVRARRCLEAEGVSVEALFAAPETDGGALAYCPRCLAQFVELRDDCSSCGDVPLAPSRPAISPP